MDKFIEARRSYERLHNKYSAGNLDKAAFQQAAEKLTVHDQFGDLWQIGIVSGKWYRFDGSQWVEDYPPPADLVLPVSQPAPIMPEEAPPAITPDLVACPQCGEGNQSGKKYCGNCGVELLPPSAKEPVADSWALAVPGMAAPFPLTGTITIGREENCDLDLKDKKASRKHARIERRQDAFWITDLGSSNGVFVNEQRISEPVHLERGDQIRIGDTVLKVEAPPPSARESATIIDMEPIPVQAPVRPQATPPPVQKPSQPENVCLQCGQPLSPTARFCAKCGTPVAQSTPPQAPAKPLCPKCQQPVKPGVKFCRNCGTLQRS